MDEVGEGNLRASTISPRTRLASGPWTALVGSAVLLTRGAALSRLVRAYVRGVPAVSQPHPPLLMLAALGAVPWLVYAGMTALRQRSGTGPDEDFTLGVHGWSALTIFALVMVFNSMIGAFRSPGWRATTATTGVASLCFGLASMWANEVPGSLGQGGGAAAVVWGAALAFLARIAAEHAYG